jgi:thiol-disulfide isomerase/thioredoxin
MLMPTWNKICKKFKNDKNVLIINIEVDNLPLLKTKYKKHIQGFPTIIKYQDGTPLEEYMHERTFTKLINFIQK